MFSLLRKKAAVRVSMEDTILVLLDVLGRNGLTRVAESQLHRLIYEAGPIPTAPMKFVRRPTTYSNDLFQCLKRLERDRLVDELVYVHDGWVPKHLYQVTRVGHSKALELENRIRTLRIVPLEDLSNSFAAAARKNGLLPKLQEEEHYSSDPA